MLDTKVSRPYVCFDSFSMPISDAFIQLHNFFGIICLFFVLSSKPIMLQNQRVPHLIFLFLQFSLVFNEIHYFFSLSLFFHRQFFSACSLQCWNFITPENSNLKTPENDLIWTMSIHVLLHMGHRWGALQSVIPLSPLCNKINILLKLLCIHSSFWLRDTCEFNISFSFCIHQHNASDIVNSIVLCLWCVYFFFSMFFSFISHIFSNKIGPRFKRISWKKNINILTIFLNLVFGTFVTFSRMLYFCFQVN